MFVELFDHLKVYLTGEAGNTAESITPASGSRYYLVVPMTATSEGSYGHGSSGPRSRSTDPCRPLSEPSACR